MKVIETIADFRRERAKIRGSLGFVPTMGFLHEGHMTLVRYACKENDAVAASIFVNPTQFGPHEDFSSYPRDMPRDLAMLEKDGTDLVFAPSAQEMYPKGNETYIDVGSVSAPLEGVRRPGHFRGVATVVAKLFNIVQPTRSYFGEKDAQQVLVIKKMAKDLDFATEIVVVPTVREPDGLAMSSRNTYLNPQERQAATVLWKSLCLATDLWRKGERKADAIRQPMVKLIQGEPLAKIDYVSIAHPETLQELDTIEGSALVSMAVRIGKTRLIDNITLGAEAKR